MKNKLIPTPPPASPSRLWRNCCAGAHRLITTSAVLIAVASTAYVRAAPDPLTGAIFTTKAGCTAVNANIFCSKKDVYLEGGPDHPNAAGLPPGDYYIRVTDPSGDVPLGGPAGPFTVNGNAGPRPGKLPCINLYAETSFSDTPNPGGEYKVWASQDPTFAGPSKTDNFHVVCTKKCSDAGTCDPGVPPEGLLLNCPTLSPTECGINDVHFDVSLADINPIPDNTGPYTITIKIDNVLRYGPAQVDNNDVDLTVLGAGIHTYTITVTDSTKPTPLSGFCEDQFTISDTGNPVFECPPQPLTKQLTSDNPCCATFDLPTATDTCEGTIVPVYTLVDNDNNAILDKDGNPVTVTSDKCFPPGEYRVHAVATDRSNNSADCYVDLKVYTEICVLKFYDNDGDGVFDAPTEKGLKGWGISLTDAKGNVTPALTGDDGTYCFQGLLPGAYTVAEGTAGGTWHPTTGTSVALTGEHELKCPVTVEFGNACAGAGGGLTLGYWSNKNGQGNTTPSDIALLGTLCLWDAKGKAYVPTKASLPSWLLSANAVNMAYMLSAQLVAMELNVSHGGLSGVSGSHVVYNSCLIGKTVLIGGNPTASNGFISINDLMATAKAALCASGGNYTVQAGTTRSFQECLKTTLDEANNRRGYVQSSPCPYLFSLPQ